MKQIKVAATVLLLPGLSMLISGCISDVKGGIDSNPPQKQTHTLTVNSTAPYHGVNIVALPGDVNGGGSGTTGFTRTYWEGATVTLTAPSVAGKNPFSSWSGCASTSGMTCTVTMSADTTVTAVYTGPAITSITLTPNTAAATIGASIQFTASAAGTGTFDSTVTWSLAGPSGYTGDLGSLNNPTSNGVLYTTPYPAPPSVTLVATSNQDNSTTGSLTLTLTQPAASTGPSLTVDAGNETHPINPYIYGMMGIGIQTSEAQSTNLPIERWGGDYATTYNYLGDVLNTSNDYYYENQPGSTSGYPDISQFNTLVNQANASKTKVIGTVPLIGWTTQRSTACSFSVKKYGAQQSVDPYNPDCGIGVLTDGNNVVNDPTDTSMLIDESFAGGWVKYLAGKFGTAAKGGVAVYQLDNEPDYWDSTHRDTHPLPFTYDELTDKSLTYAKAVKDNDPTAEVSGPVTSEWMSFFYSKKDIETGWYYGPCYCDDGDPVDRLAHGDVPFMDYYLQQFKKYEDTNNVRLLDYVDIHGYFAPNNLAFSTAGETDLQQIRLNSTRVFWDPTYTDPNYTDPNNRTSSAQPYPPQLIPLLHSWVATDYPGTKTAITEYNWGGQEAISGALAQADILGIFGRENLDMGSLWPYPDPVKQVPGVMAFNVYRNYDGANSTFGNAALASTSTDQGKLAVYGALRTADGDLTVVVINKTYGDLTSTLSLPNLTPNGNAKAFLYSNANLYTIVAEPDVTVKAPDGGGTTSSVQYTFPAQSITILVIPKI